MNGIYIFNKPKNITSHDVIYLFRKKFGIKKVGHTGTLDPIATGVLPICIGKATKISQYLTADNKKYIFTMKFGIETDTLDITGETINSSKRIPTFSEVENILTKFKGKIMQKPPKYSALKVNGKKLYEYAREGIEVEIKEREVEIFNISLKEQLSFDSFVIELHCSSGTYVRSLIRDIAYALNTFATMTDLVRISSGQFDLSNSFDSEYLEKSSLELLEKNLIPMDKALDNLETFIFPESFYFKAINGVAFETDININGNIRVYCNSKFIGIGENVKTTDFSGIKIKKLLIGD